MMANLISILNDNLPIFLLRLLNRTGLHLTFIPPQNKISWGDFNSIFPFSKDFGYDHSVLIDRYYIENFLLTESGHIKGDVLEIADNAYSLKFDGKNITKSDVLHLNADTPSVTYVGDLSKGPFAV